MNRCACRECRAGDALPDHLQGWPGAYQMRLLDAPMRSSTMNDPARTACEEYCAEAGDPPCFVLDERAGVPWTPCADCLRAAGKDAPEPQDPNAVVRPLL